MATINVAFLIASALDNRLIEVRHSCGFPARNGRLTKASTLDAQVQLNMLDYPFACYYDTVRMDFVYLGNTAKYTDAELQTIMVRSRRNFSTEADYNMHWSVTPNNCI